MKLVRCKTIRTLHIGKRYADGLPCATLFVQGLRERYLTRRNAWRALHLLMRTAPYNFIQQIFNRNEVHRIQCNLLAPRLREAEVSSAVQRDVGDIARRIIPQGLAGEQGYLVKTSDQKSLWVNVVERYRRIEMSNAKDMRPTVTQVGDQSRSQMFPGVYPKMETSSMPLVVRAAPDAEVVRSLTRPNSNALSDRTDKAPMAGVEKYTSPSGISQLTDMPEHDMNHLADRVISRIDQRIAAHRERMGRS